MRRLSPLAACLLLLLLTVAGPAEAFDGKRKGFCLGFGAGVGTISYAFEGQPYSEALWGLATTLNVGAGISDQVLILYSGHTIAHFGSESNLVWGTPTIIVRYYFKPTVGSFYVFGGPAAAFGVGWDESEAAAGTGGVGVTAGGGYQFSRQFQAQFGTVLTSENQESFNTFHVTMNLMGF